MTGLFEKQRICVHYAIAIGAEGKRIKMPGNSFTLADSDSLTRDQTEMATRMFCVTINSVSGNSGGRNLYELHDGYLRNPEIRDAINAILIKHGKAIH
jgi:hypothetical protein